DSRMPTADYQIVSPEYFSTIDLPIVGGRAFDARDTRQGLEVCIVNEAFVRAHLHGREPIGQRVALRDSGSADAPPTVREIGAAGVIAAGTLIGLTLAIALGRLLSTMLFGVQPLDPSTFAAVVVVLALTGALSMAGPAWRATRVDPIRALRQD